MNRLIAMLAAVAALVCGAAPSEPGYVRHGSVKPSTYVVTNAYLAARQGILEEVSDMLAGETGRVFTNTYNDVFWYTNNTHEVHSVTNNFYDELWVTNRIYETKEVTNNFNNVFWYTNNTHEVRSVTNNTHEIFWYTNFTHEVVSRTNNYYNVTNVVTHHYEVTHETNNVYTVSNITERIDHYATNHVITAAITNNVFEVTNRYIVVTNEFGGTALKVLVESRKTADFVPNVRLFDGAEADFWLDETGTAPYRDGNVTQSVCRVDFDYGGYHWAGETRLSPYSAGYLYSGDGQYRLRFTAYSGYWDRTLSKASGGYWAYVSNDSGTIPVSVFTTNIYQSVEEEVDRLPLPYVTHLVNSHGVYNALLGKLNRTGGDVSGALSGLGPVVSVTSSSAGTYPGGYYFDNFLDMNYNMPSVRGTFGGDVSYLGLRVNATYDGDAWMYVSYRGDGVLRMTFKDSEIKANPSAIRSLVHNQLLLFPDPITHPSGTFLTDTDVPSWAKASSKPTYTASEVGALPSTTTALKNPYALTFTGAATGSYDGSASKTVSIPSVPSWALASSKPSYTASEVGALPSTTTALKNPYALTFTGAATGSYDGSSGLTVDIPVPEAQPNKTLTFTGAVSKSYDGSAAVTVNIPSQPTIPSALPNPYALSFKNKASGGTTLASYSGSSSLSAHPGTGVAFSYSSSTGLEIGADLAALNGSLMLSYVYSADGTHRMTGDGLLQARPPMYYTVSGARYNFDVLDEAVYGDPTDPTKLTRYRAHQSRSADYYLLFDGTKVIYHLSSLGDFTLDCTDMRELPDPFYVSRPNIRAQAVYKAGAFTSGDAWSDGHSFVETDKALNNRITDATNATYTAFTAADGALGDRIAAATNATYAAFKAADTVLNNRITAATNATYAAFKAADTVLNNRITDATNAFPRVERSGRTGASLRSNGIEITKVSTADSGLFAADGHLSFANGWPMTYRVDFGAYYATATSESVIDLGNGDYQVVFAPDYSSGSGYALLLSYYSSKDFGDGRGVQYDCWVAEIFHSVIGYNSVRSVSNVKLGSPRVTCSTKVGGGTGYSSYALYRVDSNGAAVSGLALRTGGILAADPRASSAIRYRSNPRTVNVTAGGTVGFYSTMYDPWPETDPVTITFVFSDPSDWNLGSSVYLVNRETGKPYQADEQFRTSDTHMTARVWKTLGWYFIEPVVRWTP